MPETTDLALYMGGDLSLDATGDFLGTLGPQRGTQRVLRRLLTNPGDYTWHVAYGAGLAAYIGRTVNQPRITGVIRTQMRREAAVAPTPAPSVSVRAQPDGSVFADVAYADATAGTTQTLAVPLGS